MDPAQLLTALPRAIAVLTDPVQCGPVTLALPQDVQATAYDYPASFFRAAGRARMRAAAALDAEIDAAAAAASRGEAAGRHRRRRRALQRRRPGGARALRRSPRRAGRPKRRRGRARCPGITRCRPAPSASPAARRPMRSRTTPISCSRVGTRLQDFTTGSHSLFPQARLVAINVNAFDAGKWHAAPVVGDASGDARRAGRAAFRVGGRRGVDSARATREARAWRDMVSAIVDVRDIAPPALPYDGEVIGAVQRHRALGRGRHRRLRRGLAAWRAAQALARGPARRLSRRVRLLVHGLRDRRRHRRQDGATRSAKSIVLVGDGSYLMLNSEIATSVMLGTKLVIVVLDNRGYALHPPAAAGVRRRRLQQSARRLRPGGGGRAGDRFRRARAVAGRAGRARRLDSRARRPRSRARAPPTGRPSS